MLPKHLHIIWPHVSGTCIVNQIHKIHERLRYLFPHFAGDLSYQFTIDQSSQIIMPTYYLLNFAIFKAKNKY